MRKDRTIRGSKYNEKYGLYQKIQRDSFSSFCSYVRQRPAGPWPMSGPMSIKVGYILGLSGTSEADTSGIEQTRGRK
jgi:hypothetical protein